MLTQTCLISRFRPRVSVDLLHSCLHYAETTNFENGANSAQSTDHCNKLSSVIISYAEYLSFSNDTVTEEGLWESYQ